MSKRDPNRVLDAFTTELTASLTAWADMNTRLPEAEIGKRVAEDAFLRSAVAWELFLADWHVAAVNRDATAFRQGLLQRYQESLAERWPGLQDFVTVQMPKHPTLTVIKGILDSRGYNVTFTTSARWVERASTELVSPWRDRVTALSTADRSLIDAVGAIRNCLAHRSTSASDAMNNALSSLSVAPDKPLRRDNYRVQPSAIGTYLYAVKTSGHRRVEIYYRRLAAIAEQLRV